MVGQATQGRINHKIKFKICSIIFLHSKERQVTAIGTRLPEIKLVYDQGQDTTISN